MHEYTRQCKLLEVFRNIGSKQLIESFEQCFESGQQPANLRTDNGGVWCLPKWDTWTKGSQILLRKTPLGCPWENGSIESLIGKLRESLMDRVEFAGIADANYQAQRWKEHYNKVRPHHLLQRKCPDEFAKLQKKFRKQFLLPESTASNNASRMVMLGATTKTLSWPSLKGNKLIRPFFPQPTGI